MRSTVGWAIAVLAAVALAVPADASAQSDFNWTGGGTSADWSDSGNWSGGTAPSAASTLGTVTFGPVSGCTTPNEQCDTPVNDVPDLTLDALSVAPDYSLSGDPITLGSGGLTATASPGEAQAAIDMPLTLDAPQTWTMNTGVVVETTVTGDEALTAHVNSGSELGFHEDAEVGPVTASGAGLLSIVPGASLNATDGEPITASDGLTIEGASGAAQSGAPAESGPIALTDASLQVGYGSVPDSSLQVAGGVSFDAQSSFETYIDDPTADSPQLDATGNIALAGTLSLTEGQESDNSCASLTDSSSATIITTTGTITGTFANAPNGSVIPLESCNEGGTPAAVEITYSAHTVTAKIAATTTTTLSSVSPSHPLTNQHVTLTAQVRTDAGAADGTVDFVNVGSPIAGCTAKPVVAGAATCTTTFAAVASPAQLTATFTQASGADQASSTSPAVNLTISPNTTTTAVVASRSRITQREADTYTATVTGAAAGSVTPTGTVAFKDNGREIPGCGTEALTALDRASCTISYKGAGKQVVTAVYSGDGNFTGSTSAPANVTVLQLGAAKIVGATTKGAAASISVSCTGAAGQRCKLALTLTVKSKGKTVTVGSAHANLSAHTKAVVSKLRIKLNSAGRRLLSHSHRLKAKLTGTQLVLGKNTKFGTKTVTFKST